MPKKRVQRSKEEVLADLRKNQEFVKKMAFVKEKFWPALIAATTSIDDAVILLSGFNNIIMQEFLGLMKQKTVFDLDLISKLDPKADKVEENKALLSLFLEYSVFEAKEIIEGMRSEINLFLLEEQKARTLDTLKTKWVDEI